MIIRGYQEKLTKSPTESIRDVKILDQEMWKMEELKNMYER